MASINILIYFFKWRARAGCIFLKAIIKYTGAIDNIINDEKYRLLLLLLLYSYVLLYKGHNYKLETKLFFQQLSPKLILYVYDVRGHYFKI